MTGFIEDSLMRMEGLDDNDITNINAVLPDIQNLVSIAQSHQKQFNRVLSVLLPVVQKVIAKQRELK